MLPACHAAYPDLREQFARVMAALNAEPLRATIIHPLTDAPFTVHLDGNDFASAVFSGLYSWQIVPYLPFLIDQIDRGNRDVALPLAQQGFRSIISPRWGMYYSVWCQEELPYNDPAAIEADRQTYPALSTFSNLIFRSDPAICQQWNVPVAPRPSLAESAIPTLILAGSYDPATPPRWGRLVAETLSRSYVYEFPGMGHTLFWSGSCAQEITAAFFRDPERAPEDCASSVVGPPVVTPQQIVVTPGVYRLSQTLGQPALPLPFALLAAFVVSWLVQATLLVGLLLRWPRASRTARWQYGATGLIGVLNIACVVAVGLIIRAALVAEPLTLGFGLPAEARPWLVLPVLATLLAVGVLLSSGITWRQQGWTRWRRGYVLVCAFVALGFVGWLQAWDLLMVSIDALPHGVAPGQQP